jgi:predicted signal transduction protein with EAL and GGDEF domain
VSRALSRALREVDLLARLGGDEFMVVVEDFEEPAILGRIAQKLLDAVAHPFRIEDHDIYVTSSIGISVYPDDSDDPEELLKHADVAMYRSKELGRNTFQFLDADLAQHRVRQHALETSLRAALKANQLKLHYQPIVSLVQTGPVVAAEALLRWDDPFHGSVSPKCSSRSPRSRASSTRSANGCCASAGRAMREAGGAQGSSSMSRSTFRAGSSIATTSRSASPRSSEKRGASLRGSSSKVTETSLLHDLDSIRKALHLLRNEGFTVAIDDFGTGYSSLTHLKHFPIDYAEDRHLVHRRPRDRSR